MEKSVLRTHQFCTAIHWAR